MMTNFTSIVMLDHHDSFPAVSPFQIDGNFALISGVNEMMIQSHNKYTIYLLPALPADAWPTGFVRGLRSRGGRPSLSSPLTDHQSANHERCMLLLSLAGIEWSVEWSSGRLRRANFTCTNQVAGVMGCTGFQTRSGLTTICALLCHC